MTEFGFTVSLAAFSRIVKRAMENPHLYLVSWSDEILILKYTLHDASTQ